ncbi:hypothetical protein FQZ97_1204430 [compost metagenome]
MLSSGVRPLLDGGDVGGVPVPVKEFLNRHGLPLEQFELDEDFERMPAMLGRMSSELVETASGALQCPSDSLKYRAVTRNDDVGSQAFDQVQGI